ncbi:MAG: polymer-forming cytoskeletal protein [Gammaproteobacteria bacterium]|nr:polymer-forming cytoskeletal protein [Gammaproteobacteria bacterium]MDE0283611.1 polymer-forming cytoskeletal protein [Gammaproteobacteria bacterium]
MLGNSRKKKTAKIDSLIGENTEITGDVQFTGGLHIDGMVKGNIFAEAGSNSVLSLSDQGRIEGEIHVPHNIIDGTVNGNVYSSEHIELEARSRITGDVYYNLLEISGGAQVSGRLVYTPDRGDEAPETEEPVIKDDYT